MDPAVWAAIVGVLGTGLLGFLGALFSGKVVPSRKLLKAEQEAATWRQSHDTLRLAYDTQNKLLVQQQLTAEITDKVMSAVHALLEEKGVVS